MAGEAAGVSTGSTSDQRRLAEPMRSRWSPSVYDDRHELSEAELATLLTAAQWAPSAGNQQPWGFVVLTRGGPGHDVLVAALSRGNSGWVPRASAVVVNAVRLEDPEREAAASYDLGQAVAHLTLQAQAMGLVAHQFAGFDKDAVAAGLGIPADHRVMTGVALGVLGDPASVSERDAERDHRVRERRPLADLVSAGRWGGRWGG